MSAVELAANAPSARVRGHRALRFLVAAGVSFYGDWLTTVALVVLLYRLTGSAMGPALYILARVAPRILGPAPGGAIADKIGPARLAAGCALAQCALTCLIVVAAYGKATWGVYVAVAGAQFINALSQPAYGALVPRVATERQLGRVNGIYSSLFSSSILVSPAVGALLLPRIAPETLILVDAATFLVAAGLLLTLQASAGPAARTAPIGVLAGLPIVMRDGVLRSFAAASVGNPIVVTALQAVLVVAAAQRFGHDNYVGWLYAAVGAGGLVGSLSFIRSTPSRITRRGIVLASFIELLPLVVFVFTPNLALAAALLFISTLGAVLYQVNGSIALQQRVPTDLLGRANAVIRSALYIGMLLGAVAAVILVQPFGWETTVLAVSGAALLLLIGGAVSRPAQHRQHPADLIPD